MDDILEKLKQACAETSIEQVAKRIGVPRPTLSLVVSGKYGVSESRPQGANPKNILAKFAAVYSQIDCPHLAQSITREQCREFAGKPRPSNPIGVQHYRACLACKHKGE